MRSWHGPSMRCRTRESRSDDRMDRRPPVAARRPGRRTRLWRPRVAVVRDPRRLAGPGRARRPRAGRRTCRVHGRPGRGRCGRVGPPRHRRRRNGSERAGRSAADRPPTRRRGVPRPQPGTDHGRRRGAGAGADPAALAPTTATAASTTPTGGRDPGARAGPRADSGARGGSRARRRGRARTPTGSGGPLGDRVHHRQSHRSGPAGCSRISTDRPRLPGGAVGATVGSRSRRSGCPHRRYTVRGPFRASRRRSGSTSPGSPPPLSGTSSGGARCGPSGSRSCDNTERWT